MRVVSSGPMFSLLTVAIACTVLAAQEVSVPPPIPLSASSLIAQPIDESQLTLLKGNVHPLARPQFDLGGAPASLPMQRMLLVLKRTPAQEFALRKMLDDQQDKRSPNYHKWLSPEQYGKRFGPTDSDMQAITAWLQSHGFQLGAPSKGRTVLEFSGSASQVAEAFHAPIHKYIVNGEQHWANSTDPQIPTALAGAVAGVLTLHNFLKKPQIHVQKQPVAVKVIPGKIPHITFPAQNGNPAIHALGPYDYATIYGSTAFTGGTNGAGTTIGIVGRSNLFSGGQDVSNFASNVFFCCGNFQVLLNGPDPGDLGGGEEAEATLDTSWTGAVAPGARIDLVVSASTNTTDGIDLSELYIIESNFADVMTESFGTCEAGYTQTDAVGVSALAEQAAAQGITYFVSSGDTGAEGCDDLSETVATGPVSANLLASTPFTTAVGGTMFNENGNDALYWASANTNNESALSYIPEVVWNESCTSANCTSGNTANIAAGSGGASVFFAKPTWQSGVAGIPVDGSRDLPDVSLTAAGHDPYLICLEGSCGSSNIFVYFVYGTSAAAPSFAGIMAQVDQEMNARQGHANYILYRLAASQAATLSQCNGSSTVTLPAGTCIFRDTTVGNNAVPGELNYGLSTAQYQAGVGYDLATGLGSVNIANLVANWNTVTFNPSTTTLTLTPTTNLTHGQSVAVNVTVAPGSGTATPTGDVSLLAFTGNNVGGQTSLGAFTLSAGSIVNSTNQLPGGNYSVEAYYAGDTTYAPSYSTLLLVTVGAETSATTMSGPFTQDSNGQWTIPITTPQAYGNPVFVRADVVGKISGVGIPTGSMTFSDTFGSIPSGAFTSLNSEGNSSVQSFFFDAGNHSISAAYLGDSSFNASSSTQPVTFTIQPGFFPSISGTSQLFISAPGSTASTAVTVYYSSGVSGTITLACTGLPSEATCAFSPAAITPSSTAASNSSNLTISTVAAHTTQIFRQSPYLVARYLGGGFAFAGVVFAALPKRRRAGISSLIVLLALIVVIPACGGGGGSSSVKHTQDPGTPAGTYNVTVTATSGTTIQSTPGFTLTVQ